MNKTVASSEWRMASGEWQRATRHLLLAGVLALLLAACSSAPPPPDWKMNAVSLIEHFQARWLEGDSKTADLALDKARGEIAKTGRLDLLARAELAACATRAAALDFTACGGYEKLANVSIRSQSHLSAENPPTDGGQRIDPLPEGSGYIVPRLHRGVSPTNLPEVGGFKPELIDEAAANDIAYARFLAGDWRGLDTKLLPKHYADLVGAKDNAAANRAVAEIKDPLPRLIAAALLFKTSRAEPATLASAIDTASERGWRRPLLAWLNVQLKRAQAANDHGAVAHLQRRIDLITGAPPAGK